jgi:hypothetical protein
MNAIVLVFSNSKLKDLVGTDALRSVLSGQYRDLVKDGTLHLQVIWDLLEDQPGFEQEDAEPAFCVLKEWEDDLKLSVEMPRAIADFGSSQVVASASHCPIPQRLKDRAIRPDEAEAKAKATLAEFDSGNIPSKDQVSTRRPALEALLALIALAGLGFGGYTLMDYFKGPNIKTVSAGSITTEIPIASAKRLGGDLSLVVTDAKWFGLSVADRKNMLKATLRNARPLDIDAVLVMDASNKLRASAQWMGEPPKIVVRLH